MGITQDFTLAPAHAHLNLLGWVTMALIGLYYRGAVTAWRRLARVQVSLAALGFWVMPLSLGGYLWTGNDAYGQGLMIGAFAALAAMVLFAAVVVLDIRDRRRQGAARAAAGPSLRLGEPGRA